jgi:hypothetical protein
MGERVRYGIRAEMQNYWCVVIGRSGGGGGASSSFSMLSYLLIMNLLAPEASRVFSF